MVEIVEEPDNNDSQSGPSTTNNRSSTYSSISEYVSRNTLDCVMFGSRVLTVFFAVNYMLPFISFINPYSSYYKIFAASAATYALRLHSRTQGTFSFSREFMARLFVEDAFHYLIYSVIFLMASPLTMALLPVVLFAGLQSISFLVKVLRETNNYSPMVGKMEAFVNNQTQNCLGIIACAEIFLVPLLVSLIFSGKGSLMMPFMYYRFLSLRYASRRNPSTRQAFYQMRMSLEQIIQSPSCPAFAKGLLSKSISFISNLAPPVQS